MSVTVHSRSKWAFRRAPKPDAAALQVQIAWTITVFLRVRGMEWLLDPATALVVRRTYETFFVHDTDGIENPEDVLALVPLNEIDYYEEFKTIQEDPALRISPLGEVAINYLADRLTSEAVNRSC